MLLQKKALDNRILLHNRNGAGALVTKLPKESKVKAQEGRSLLKWPEKFQSEKPHVPGGILAQYLCGDGRGFTGEDARRGWRGSGNSQVNNSVGPQNMYRGDTGASCADIERLGQFDEFHARGIGSAQKDRHLKLDTGRATLMRWIHALPFFKDLRFQALAT
jgi:hypothetical protein